MIPVYILSDDITLPLEGTYYVVAKDGIYLHKDNGLVEATIKVDRIPFLREVEPRASLQLPKLPPQVAVQALLFFRRVYQQHGSEAAVLLHYSPLQQRYLLHCPQQRVGPASVHYTASDRFEDYQLVGTIHSHASMAAFHSGIDDADERHFDGLHITVGRLDQPYFTLSCSIVVNGQRFYKAPDSVILGIIAVEWQPVERLSYRRKQVPESTLIAWLDPSWVHFEEFEVVPRPASDQFYDMVLPDDQDYRHVGVPKAWFDHVTSTWSNNGLSESSGSTTTTKPTKSWRWPQKQERRETR